MKKYFDLVLFGIFIIFIGLSCEDEGLITDADIPDSNISYGQHIQPVFNFKCATSACHDDGSMAAGLSLTTWFNTTANPAIVFPNNPGNSLLVWVIDRNNGVATMPPPQYQQLTDKEIQAIKTWISEGAKNN